MTARSTTPPIDRRAQRKQDRRQTFIEAARRPFFEDGYAATSMSGLLTTLGGSKATLWSHFRSKEELFAAVVEDATSSFRAKLDSELLEDADIEETLVTFCRDFMNKMFHPDGIGIWRLIVAESGRAPEVGRIFYERAAQRVERKLSDYLQKLIVTGRLRDENSARMAQVLISLCSTRHNLRLWGIASPDTEQLAQDAERFAGYFLKLFGKQPEDVDTLHDRADALTDI